MKEPYHQIIWCVIYSITKEFNINKIPLDIKGEFDKFPKQNESFSCRLEASDLNKLSNLLRVKINVYCVKNNEKYKEISLEQSIGKYEDEVNLLTQRNLWAYIIKKENLHSRYQCHTCARWITYQNLAEFKREHYNKCRRCTCERAYKVGDAHPLHCKKHGSFRKKKSKKSNGEIKLAQREKEVPFKDHQHFADFETFPQKDLNGKFVVYAAGLAICDQELIHIDIGKDSLRDFMNRIFNTQGILWFFNGSKFDTYFIVEYLIENKIPYDQEETIICDRQVIQLTLNTKKGKLVIKDLAKFFVGSLAYNCKSFGVDSSDTKGEFDHESMNGWDKVKEKEKEISEYLTLDVKALRSIYLKSAEEIAKQFGLLMCKYISIAQLSFAISSLFIKEKRLYRCNTRNGELDAIQATYYGGRVPVTTPIYKSKYFSKICREYNDQGWYYNDSNELSWNCYSDFFLDEFWNELKNNIKNDLYYGDINSLYPSQMYGNKFACGTCHLMEINNEEFHSRIMQELITEKKNAMNGKFELVGHDETLASDKQQLKLVWSTKFELKWSYRFLKVDLVCPKDIYIPFVMSRNDKGRNIQNLEDKINHWITGAELIEAMILGYEVKKVHCYYLWSRQEYLFQEFISYNYKKKSEAPRGSALYEIPKLVMNGNSGKHGQKSQSKKNHMYIGEEISMSRITCSNGQHIINEETGETLAVTCQSEVDPDFSPYSVHLSSQILAWSRVHMSRFTRLMDAYRNPQKVPIEGDTDSLVLPYKALHEMDQNLRKIMFGPHLGQMKDEMPDDVLICQLNIAPKTKFKIYLTKVKEEGPMRPNEVRRSITVIRSFFKSKGIPHMRDVYDPFCDYSVGKEKKEEALKISEFIEKRQSTKEHYDKVKFKEPLFIRRYIGNETTTEEEVPLELREVNVTDRLSWCDLLGILMGWFDVECLFGGMVRNLKDAVTLDETGIAPDYLRRSISKKSWWEPGVNRCYDPADFPFVLTKPKGFE